MVISIKDRNTQVLVAGGVSIGLTALIMNLLHPKPAFASPGNGGIDLTEVKQALGVLLSQNDEIDIKLNIANGTLQQILDAIKANDPQGIIDAISNLKLGSIPVTQVKPNEPVQIFNQAITTVTPVGQPLMSTLMDFRTGHRLLLKAESTLDQAVNLQAIGDIFNTASFRQVNINGVLALPAGGNLTAGLAWDDWHPYVGMSIAVPVAPTTGSLRIYGVVKNVE